MIFFRLAAWSLLITIVVMTVVPAPLRVVTGAPHNVEHALIFLATGIAAGLGYELRSSVACAAAVTVCAGLELVQLVVPGRHARMSDFLIDAVAACVGIGIAWTVRHLTEGNCVRQRCSTSTKPQPSPQTSNTTSTQSNGLLRFDKNQ
jgi:VanZ family protein